MLAELGAWYHTLLAGAAEVLARLEALRFIGPATSSRLLWLIIIGTFALAAGAFVVRRARRHPAVILLSLAIPASVLAAGLIDQSLRGEADQYCQRYEGGKLTFSLIGLVFMTDDPRKPFENESAVLVVRAARWSDVHICRIALTDKRLTDLAEQLARVYRTYQQTPGSSFITFTFGSASEKPNVRWRPPPSGPDRKTAPPEVANPHDA